MEQCNHDSRDCVKLVPIFKHLNAEELKMIYGIAQRRIIKKDEYLYQQGDLSAVLYVVYQGSIKIFRININGKEQVLRVVKPGDFLGELTLFSEVELKDNAVALEDTVICVIDAFEFKTVLNKIPSIAVKVLDVMSRRLEAAENAIESLTHNTVSQRVAKMLVDYALEENVFELPMKKGDIASQLGISQETLSRTLSVFQDQDIISLKGQRTIIIRNREALQHLSIE